MSKHATLSRLRTILSELFDARYQGMDTVRIYRAQGLADGYMRALADLRVFGDAELLDFVNKEQRRAAARADMKVASSMAPKAATLPA